MGGEFVGLVHPSKVYNVIRIKAPILYIGPSLSHISEIVKAANGEVKCFSVLHGEVDLAVNQIRKARDEYGRLDRPAASPVVSSLFSKETVLPKLITELESA